MRPATLPPAATTYTGSGGYASATYSGDPGVRNPYINPSGPPSGILSGGYVLLIRLLFLLLLLRVHTARTLTA